MKYAFIPRTGFVAPQIFEVSNSGCVCGIAFVQPTGNVGAFSGVDYEEQWEGATFDTLEQCLAALFPEVAVSPNEALGKPVASAA